ncbi:DUF1177 domain-containing protein [Clostridium sp. Cult2]|uniref:DUF1177 domain-containing protein n=1 Tax=Clostridium sp. Cult2 TaxID=2079003 RepID=UPI001F225FB9|nr:DUF1177 domain-containing protein [Clostridium sp. Cult2]MCF6465946.1 DUF1177 domain-containing protein [Clostridium sp. Cult2]
MILKQIIELFDLLDNPAIDGIKVRTFFEKRGLEDIKVERVKGAKGYTDFIKITIPGTQGKTEGGQAPTLGIVGRLGGIGARPSRMGFVSDGDGALAALSVALKLAEMKNNNERLLGDVIIATHICPNAPIKEHYPVPFMDSPVDMETMNKLEVSEEMDAILSIDTTKGNNVINYKGFAISPTVKEGYILRTSEDLLRIMSATTGKLPVAFPLTQQDITPYGNGLYHINSILQPSVATKSPVVGVAITTETPVGGCYTGATHFIDIENAARFSLEVAKEYSNNNCSFYDKGEYARIIKLYGSLNRFQTHGN